jgi:hypothetical protein
MSQQFNVGQSQGTFRGTIPPRPSGFPTPPLSGPGAPEIDPDAGYTVEDLNSRTIIAKTVLRLSVAAAALEEQVQILTGVPMPAEGGPNCQGFLPGLAIDLGCLAERIERCVAALANA